jgi:hypothetical protein
VHELVSELGRRPGAIAPRDPDEREQPRPHLSDHLVVDGDPRALDALRDGAH